MVTAIEGVGVVPPRAGHEANGRFAAGNSGGPGNPFGQRLAANRDAILDAIGPEEVKRLMISLYERGMEGNVAAARLCLLYSTGKPPVQPAEVGGEGAEATVERVDEPVRAAAPEEAARGGETAAWSMDRRQAETLRLIDYMVEHRKVPTEWPFPPFGDGADATAAEERRRLLAVFGQAFQEMMAEEGSPFERLVNGRAAKKAV